MQVSKPRNQSNQGKQSKQSTKHAKQAKLAKQSKQIEHNKQCCCQRSNVLARQRLQLEERWEGLVHDVPVQRDNRILHFARNGRGPSR